jgi:MFS family permease
MWTLVSVKHSTASSHRSPLHFSLPLRRWVPALLPTDRTNRKTLTVMSAVSWSIATLGTAYADSYETLVACRIAMGLACAFSTPTAYTLIQNNVPPTKVATASSLYGTGVALGSGLASLTLLLDNNIGWRPALYVIAATGFASAAISLLTLPDDNKKEKDSNDDNNSSSEDIRGLESILEDVSTAFSTDRAQWIYRASFLRFCSGLCIGVWSAPYFRMVFDGRTDDYSVAQAVISAVGASVSGLLGGTIADQLSSSGDDIDKDKDAVGRRLWVPVVGSILAAPTWYFAVHSPESFEIFMAWLAAEYFVAECWFGPTISTLQSTVGPKIGGTAQGLFTLTGAVANFAPSILGYIYGQAISGDSGGNESSGELSNLLSAAVCFGYISSAFCFGMAARSAPPSQADPDRTL